MDEKPCLLSRVALRSIGPPGVTACNSTSVKAKCTKTSRCQTVTESDDPKVSKAQNKIRDTDRPRRGKPMQKLTDSVQMQSHYEACSEYGLYFYLSEFTDYK